ncbi:Innexin unc-9 [Schistosoma japonicum]|uniref:Innexin n=1 Tax=Schistosoma japonicum TaxID=6182 RepID=A0A4Z2DW96_SCHJA|nr:Innexin unc-9 [Schistosoma japonicum]
MIGTEFLDYLSKFQIATYVGVEDFADKFNFLITVMVLMICTTIVTVKQYMIKPISCYMATDLGGKNLLDYVENYCWVQGTIPISYSGRVPETDEGWAELEKHKLLYYQWVPFVLGLQCILFYLPRLIWQMICYNRVGTDVQHLVLCANQAVHAGDDQRTKMVQHLAKTLEQLLFQQQKKRMISKSYHFRRRQHRSDCNSCINITSNTNEQPLKQHLGKTTVNRGSHDEAVRHSDYNDDDTDIDDVDKNSRIRHSYRNTVNILKCVRYTGTFLSLMYLLIKLCYLSNSVSQLFLMQYFLGFTDFNGSLFGIAVMYNILHGRDWQSTLIFPRVAFCYAPVKHLGTNVNTATAQCVLPTNMLNEKIYIFLWWWILLVCVVNAYSLLHWCFQFTCQNRGCKFVLKYIKLSNILTSSELYLARRFAHKFLRRDGMFLLRILASNAGEMITSEIINEMWLNYRRTVIEPEIENHYHHNAKLNHSDVTNEPVHLNSITESGLSRDSKIDLLSSVVKENDYGTNIQTSASSILTNHMQDSKNINIELQREYSDGLWPRVRHRMWKCGYLFMISKRLGTRLFGIYLFIKCLYLVNAIGQIFMMQAFLGLKTNHYTLFGITISKNILSGLDWEVTMIFPRVGFCLVPLKHFGSNNYATAQCILPVNMLNERIYMFLWFWIVLAATITAISIPAWFARMSYEKSRTRFIKKYLKLGEQVNKKDKYMIEKFTRLFLRNDGVFLLRMIAINAGELICSEIICQLWHIFREKYFYRDLLHCKRGCDDKHHLGVRLSRGITNSG